LKFLIKSDGSFQKTTWMYLIQGVKDKLMISQLQ